MPKKIIRKKIVRNEDKHNLEVDMVRLGIEMPRHIRDNFKEAVESKGKTMTEVLVEYMQKYVWKQTELEKRRVQKSEQSEE